MAPSRRHRPLRAVVGAVGGVLLGVVLAGCGGAPLEVDPEGVDGLVVPTPSPDPADFVDRIDNPYLPLRAGSEWVYDVTGEDPGTRTVTVTNETRVVAGVTATVVREVVTDAGGEVVEETDDWFAQDRAGNVWHLGRDTTAFDRQGRPGTTTDTGPDAGPDTGGSWEAGVGGAQAGLAMPDTPRVGDGYEQEYAAGEAEDRAEVLALDEVRQVGGILYDDLLVTEDTTPLEPGLVERSFYAAGTGLVYVETVSGGAEQVELVSFSRG